MCVNITVCRCLRFFLYLSACLRICRPACLRINRSVCVSVSVSVPVCLSVSVSISESINTSTTIAVQQRTEQRNQFSSFADLRPKATLLLLLGHQQESLQPHFISKPRIIH